MAIRPGAQPLAARSRAAGAWPDGGRRRRASGDDRARLPRPPAGGARALPEHPRGLRARPGAPGGARRAPERRTVVALRQADLAAFIGELRGAGPGPAVGGPRRPRHARPLPLRGARGPPGGRSHGEPQGPARLQGPAALPHRGAGRGAPARAGHEHRPRPPRPRHARGALRHRPARVGADRAAGGRPGHAGRDRHLLRQGQQGASRPPRRGRPVVGESLSRRGASPHGRPRPAPVLFLSAAGAAACPAWASGASSGATP